MLWDKPSKGMKDQAYQRHRLEGPRITLKRQLNEKELRHYKCHNVVDSELTRSMHYAI
jgi:hypothetical protein